MLTRNLRFYSYLVVSLSLVISPSLLASQDAAPTPANVISQGTVFLIQLTDRLDTRNVKAGDHFHARLAEPLLSPTGGLMIDQGKKIKGHISAVEPGLHTRLLLSFDEMETQHGWVPLMATVTGVPGEHGLQQVGNEGEIGRKGMTKEEIAEAVVIGASEGAVEGVRNHDKRQAAAGAGNGAADSAFSAFQSGHDLILDKGTALEIRLDRNLQIPARP
ncbi:MAG TPA: hypothetical protein VI386_27165 [Candidatus Sulfotelmatobacter sp.]